MLLETPAYARAVRRILPSPAREPLRGLATALVAPLARRRARELLACPPVRLNLGSGFAPVTGWTNVDLVGAPVDLPWHLARGLPFPDGSVDAVYSEHLFEHLPLAAARRLMAESVRVLPPAAWSASRCPTPACCCAPTPGPTTRAGRCRGRHGWRP